MPNKFKLQCYGPSIETSNGPRGIDLEAARHWLPAATLEPRLQVCDNSACRGLA